MRHSRWLRSTQIILFATVVILCSMLVSVAKGEEEQPPSTAQFSAGQEAVEALGLQLPDVAAAYGMDPIQLRALLLRDHTLHVDVDGRLFYIDEAFPDDEATSRLEAQQVADPPFPVEETFSLHSLPGANHTIYLDFDGHVTTGTNWNSVYGVATINSPAYDIDNDPASYSMLEIERVQKTWQIVAEDFAPFQVNVTTEDPGEDALRYQGGGDTRWGTRVLITEDTFANCGCGGHAFIGSFGFSIDEPVFVYGESLTAVAEASSHEVGHALKLSHDGTRTSAYYTGHGSGATSWAPIMGASYDRRVTQWSRGEYYAANNGGSNANYANGPDDLAIISALGNGNGFGYRTDDHGNTDGTASAIPLSGDDLAVYGIIERTSDVDVFRILNDRGSVDLQLSIATALPNSNLDILARLYDSTGNLVAQSNPANLLSVSFALGLSQRSYYLHIEGAGVGDPLSASPVGYTAYGSLGQYSMLGTMTNVNDPPSFGSDPIVEESAVEGVVYAGSLADDANDVDGDLLGFSKIAGPAWLTVAGDGALSGTAGAGDIGLNVWMIQVRDGAGEVDQATLHIRVLPPNVDPGFDSDPIVEASAMEDSPYAATLADEADDPNGDPMTFMKVAGPSWLGVAADGSLTGTPGNDEVGLNSWAVQVSDDRGGVGQATLEITVLNVNDAPTFNSGPVVKGDASEDSPYSDSLADDVTDIDGDSLTYTRLSGPTWLNVATNGALSGTPANDDVGPNSWLIRVSDGNGGLAQETLQIMVLNTNDAPTFATDPVVKPDTFEDLFFSASLVADATDPDVDAGPLAFAALSGPAWLNVTGDGLLSGTPGNDDVGPNSWTVRVSDGKGGVDQATLRIKVINVNDAPTFTDDRITEADATEEIAYAATLAGSASDIDGDPLSFARLSGPEWLEIAANGGLSGTPANDDVGDNSWAVRVSDGKGGVDQATLHIRVINVNDAPTFVDRPIVKAGATEGVAYVASLAGHVTDVDGDPLSFFKLSGPGWLNLAADGGLSGTPGNGDVGANSWTVLVSDGKGGEDQGIVEIKVTGVPPIGPTNLTATTAGRDRINLTWRDNASDEAGFRVERAGSEDGPWNEIATLPIDTIAYADVGLVEDSHYFYRVYAFDGDGRSAPSKTAAAKTDVGLTLHIAGLTDRSSTENNGSWTAAVSVLVVDAGGAPVPGSTVSGIWSDGAGGSDSCLSDRNGRCTVARANLAGSVAGVTFVVSNVARENYSYQSTANQASSIHLLQPQWTLLIPAWISP